MTLRSHSWTLACVLIAAASLMALAPSSNAQCTPSTTYGLCAGPNARSEALSLYLTQTNSGCPIDKRAIPKDNDPTQIMCGDCVPGTSGWDDPSRDCKVNEYCTDEATCAPIKDSPQYHKQCPYETGSTVSFCGGGLRCIEHACQICVEGAIDYSDGKQCIDGEWTFSRRKQSWKDPGTYFTFVIMLLLMLCITLATTVLAFLLWTFM